MAAYMSQRPEDKKREKTVRFNETDKVSTRGTARASLRGFKTGPPEKKRDQPVSTHNAEPDKDIVQTSERNQELHLRGKGMPYVDVPPSKVTMRSLLSDPINETQENRVVPAYKSRAPVEVGLDVEKLVEDILKVEVNMPLRDLAAVSTSIQKEIRKQVTKTRVPVEPVAQVNLQEEDDRSLVETKDLPVSAFMTMAEVSDEIPEGSIVASDPVIQYLLEHENADSKDLVVAKPSESLRALHMKINHMGQEECVHDDGSEIVSMARTVAIAKGLTWDPLLSCTMGGSTNHHERTLGIARNVNMTTGGVVAYLQVHILENPPYKVLLGRPFDALMKSVVRTREDGSSEIELTDPNTGKVAVVPTYKRGKGPEEIQRQNFQSF